MRPEQALSFNMLDLQKYYFTLWGYTISHSLMAVRALQNPVDESYFIYLIFENVMYFSGPTRWEGIIKLGEEDECLALLQSLRSFRDLPTHFLSGHFKL